jgi:hypothetical protein
MSVPTEALVPAMRLVLSCRACIVIADTHSDLASTATRLSDIFAKVRTSLRMSPTYPP